MGEEKKIPRFDISAGVVKQLGEELVTDEVTAIMELVKNSYDADADWVKIEIETRNRINQSWAFYKNSKPGYITIEDNGFGMSEQDIWDKWMKISLSYKKRFKKEGKTTPKGRTPLGDKGLGRLSTQKLGNRLEMLTGEENTTKNTHVAFDWDDFNDDSLLTTVPVYIDNVLKDKSEKGTKLLLSDLKDVKKWESVAFDKFRGQLSQMLYPYKKGRVFHVYLKLNGQIYDFDELNENVKKNAVASFEFTVNEEKISIEGHVKLQKLNGGTAQQAVIDFEKYILPDFGRDFFSYLTDKKNNKKYCVENITFSDKGGIFFSFKKDIVIKELGGLQWLVDEINEEILIDDNVNDIEKKFLIGEKSINKKENNLLANRKIDNKNIENANESAEKIIFAHPGNFKGELNDFYFLASDAINQAFNNLAEFKRIVQNQVGVRIFRNGFAIKPYGIDNDDWLKFSGGSTSGGSHYVLRPGNVIGHVLIDAKENSQLKEKTDREGFVDSPYTNNFMRIMNEIVDEINTLLENTRRSFNDYKAQKGKEKGDINSVTDSFKKLKGISKKSKEKKEKAKRLTLEFSAIATHVKAISSKTKKEFAEEYNRFKILVDQSELLMKEINDFNESDEIEAHIEYLQPKITSLEEQLSDFAELAGLGLTSEALSHELANIVNRVIEETDGILKEIKGKPTVDADKINVYIEYVRSAMRAFKKQLSHLSPSLRYVRETIEVVSVAEFVKDLQDYYGNKFNSIIKFEIVQRAGDFYIKINKGKLTQIVDNIILNSEYWLTEKLKSEPSFKPKVTIEITEPFIKIYDNGNGISESIHDRVFQPFVTSKPKKVGRGLGLFIVQQLLDSVGCDILLLNEKNKNGNRYIFQINFSSIINPN